MVMKQACLTSVLSATIRPWKEEDEKLNLAKSSGELLLLI